MSSSSVIDLGCGARRDPRATVGMDFYPYPQASIIHNLLDFPWPIKDSSFDGAISHQTIEHFPHGVAGEDPFFRFFDEVWRILKPGGTFSFDVPHYLSPELYGDPTHQRFLNEVAFTFLWDPTRDPFYPRKVWEFVEFHMDRAYSILGLKSYHAQKYWPAFDRWVCRRKIGTPHYIFLTIRKPRA